MRHCLCYHQHYNIIILNLINITIINFTGRQRLDVGRVPSRDGPCWLCGGGQGGQAAGGDNGGDDGGDFGDDGDDDDDNNNPNLLKSIHNDNHMTSRC